MVNVEKTVSLSLKNEILEGLKKNKEISEIKKIRVKLVPDSNSRNIQNNFPRKYQKLKMNMPAYSFEFQSERSWNK